MFEAHVKSRTGRLLVKVEAPTIKALIAAISEAQEIFDGDTNCGACQSAEIQYRTRQADKYTFYEQLCRKCGAVLSYGQKQEGGGLWPKRRHESGELFESRGWVKFIPTEDGR